MGGFFLRRGCDVGIGIQGEDKRRNGPASVGFSVFQWSDAFFFLKGLDEVGSILEARLEANVFNRQIGVFEHEFCVVQPKLDQIIMGGESGILAEATVHMSSADAELTAERIERNIHFVIRL